MIGKLKGTVDGIGEDHAIVDVHGVGYVVQASSRTLQGLNNGEAVVLFIETQVREDAIRLFGFVAEQEREWFRLLQSVQGVGAKVALAILSIMTDIGLSAFSTSVSDRAAPKPVADAVSALSNLGYPQAHAMTAIAAAVKALGDEAETSALIRFGLKELAK